MQMRQQLISTEKLFSVRCGLIFRRGLFSFVDEVLYSGLYHARLQHGLGLYVSVVPSEEMGRHQLTVQGNITS